MASIHEWIFDGDGGDVTHRIHYYPAPEEDSLNTPTPDPTHALRTQRAQRAQRAQRVEALRAARSRRIGLAIFAGLLALACLVGACLVGVPAAMMGAF